MRVSSQQTSNTMMRSVDYASENLSKLMTEISCGKKVLVPSDDPIASTRMTQLNRQQASIEQYQSNITNIAGSLSQQESILSSVSNSLLAVRDDLVQAANGSNVAETLNSLGSEIESLTESMVAAINYQNANGSYIFSGTASNQQTITQNDEGRYIYNGNYDHRTVTIASGVEMESNVTAGEIFFDSGTDVFNTLNDLSTLLQNPDIDPNAPAIRESITNAIDVVDATINSLSTAISTLGERQNTLSMMNNAQEGVKTSNTIVMGQLTDLDYAEAVTELSTMLVAIQATQETYIKISGLSLFNTM
jgi:flagellar hook-associated protein 3 FlgL